MTLIVAIPNEEAQNVLEFIDNNDSYFFNKNNKTNYLDIIDPKKFVAKERSELEEDENYRQLISYAVMYNPNDKTVFVYERLSKTTEKRLIGNKSIGIGGHTDYKTQFASSKPRYFMIDALEREIQEEVQPIREPNKFIRGIHYVISEPIGSPILLNKSKVDKVHMGIVYLVKISKDIEINKNESKVNTGKMIHIDDLKNMIQENPEKFEAWSLEAFDRVKNLL